MTEIVIKKDFIFLSQRGLSREEIVHILACDHWMITNIHGQNRISYSQSTRYIESVLI